MKECFCKNQAGTYYQSEDFVKAPKLDAHLHYNIFDDGIVKYADTINMKLLTVNVDIGFPIAKQLNISRSLKEKYPDTINFIGTFDPSGFAGNTFSEKAVEQIKKCMDAGAKGIKIWKNIGMSLRDKNGKYLMADDPVFVPVFEYLQKENIIVLAHLGEPRNCWLPFDQMTMASDVRYFKMCPQYHMHLHPEAPTYERQIAARDHLLEQYPQLNLVGAHLGSLEWNIDEVADRLERYPQFSIDLSGRMGHLHLHAVLDREKLCRFLIRYQDRIMYGSDYFFASWGIRGNLSYHLARRRFVRKMSHVMHQGWEKDWRFFATDAMIGIEKINRPDAPETIEGLRLPKQIVDRIFYENACRIYRI
jgi:predicted TIM-barrel fold metal-dependent hydrolase